MKTTLVKIAPTILFCCCTNPQSIANNIGEREQETRPNVLFLFSDQHNADVMACAGHNIVKTPTMDAIAQSGVRFDRAYCQAGISVASRTSLMSGVYPRETGVIENKYIIDSEQQKEYIMLQYLFQQSGYKTGCFGKRHLPKGYMSGGWDSSATTISPNQDPSDENYYDWLKELGIWDAYKGIEANNKPLNAAISPLKNEERDAAYTAEKTINFITTQAQANEPFFIWASFHGPHQPYTPTQYWADMYPVSEMPLPSSVDEAVDNLPLGLRSWRNRTGKCPWNLADAAADKTLFQRYLSYYFGQVSEVDYYMGEIIEELKKQGLYENTIIIYASDHGDFIAEHGMVEKCAPGHNVYEATLRVPMIISWRGNIQENVVSDELVGLIDIYPTIVDMVGLNKNPTMQTLSGKSLHNHLKYKTPIERDYIFSENWSQLTIISKTHKLGVWIDPGNDNYSNWVGRNPDMLFDHCSYPMEVTNQIDNSTFSSVEQTLRDEIEKWVQTTPSSGHDAFNAYYQ